MVLHRVVIGVKFNKRIFKLQSVGGVVIDEILDLCEKDKELGANYYNQVSTPLGKGGEYTFSLIKDKRVNVLSVLPDQFIFKKSSESNGAISLEKAIEDFQKIWKVANKTCKFGGIRRLGLVGEYRITPAGETNAASKAISSLTKFSAPKDSTKFQLMFEDRGFNSKGSTVNQEQDEFVNKIYSFYLSEMDETPSDGQIFANLDVQKYYNPAKLDPLGEIRSLKEIYLKSKNEFKKKLDEMGLSDK